MKKMLFTILIIVVFGTYAYSDEQADKIASALPKPKTMELGVSFSVPAVFRWIDNSTDRMLIAIYDFNSVDYYAYVASKAIVTKDFLLGCEVGIGGSLNGDKKTDDIYEYYDYDPLSKFAFTFPLRVFFQFGEGTTFLRGFVGMNYSFHIDASDPMNIYAGVKLAVNGFFIEGYTPILTAYDDSMINDDLFDMRIAVGVLGVF
jgi:hypothetical protein